MKEEKRQVGLGTSSGWRKGKGRLEKRAEQLLNICSLPGTMCQGLGWLKWRDDDHKDSWPLIWAQILFNRQRRTTDSASSWTSYQISYIDLHTAIRIFLKEKKKKGTFLRRTWDRISHVKYFPILEKKNPVTCRPWCNLALVYFSKPNPLQYSC